MYGTMHPGTGSLRGPDLPAGICSLSGFWQPRAFPVLRTAGTCSVSGSNELYAPKPVLPTLPGIGLRRSGLVRWHRLESCHLASRSRDTVTVIEIICDMLTYHAIGAMQHRCAFVTRNATSGSLLLVYRQGSFPGWPLLQFAVSNPTNRDTGVIFT